MDEGLPTHQDWTQPGATTPPPAMPPCPICLGDIDPDSQQQHRPHRWPGCQHPIHLGCLMHFVTRQARPTCPACRQPWTPEAGQHLDQARAAAQLEWPVPETPADTTAPRDHPPNPPADIIPLCCPRLALINPSQPELDASWRELPTRHMEWAPNMDQATREWQPEWVCLRCNRTVTPNDLAIQTAGPPPICSFHGPRRLALDVRHNERGWACSRGFPPHILQWAPARIDTPAPPSAHPAAGRRLWEHQGPPRDGQTIPHANSWFYFPLLLAGANQLHPDASQEWRAHPRAGPEWQNLVTQLREAPAIPWQQFTLQILQQLARDTGHQVPAAETALVEQLVTAGSREPAGAQIHLT